MRDAMRNAMREACATQSDRMSPTATAIDEALRQGKYEAPKGGGLFPLTGSGPPTLRPYQTEAIDRLRACIAGGKRRPLLVLPTGAGKTVVAADIIRSAVAKGSRCLFLAPRRELVAQTSRKLDDVGVAHGVILAGADERDGLDANVHVAGIDTILARAVRRKAIDLPDYELVIIDEAHLSATKTRQELLDRWPDAVRLGLTATPTRKDGKALGAIFDEIVDPAPVSRLTDEGYLVPARYFAPSQPDLEGVRIIAGDFHKGDLDKAMNQPVLIGDVVEHWLEHAGGRRTVVFGCSVAHAVALADEFLRHGVAAESVDAKTPQSERDAIFERFRDGRTQALTNCMLASLGFDLPALSCVVIARPTRSLMLYLQMIGRGLRPADGKSHCLVLDHSGCVHEHGFAHEERPWTLEGRYALGDPQGRTKAAADRKQIVCPECDCVFEAARVCPECGHELRPNGKAVETIDGRLVDVTGTAAVEPDPIGFHAELRAIAQERGYKLGWAAHQHRARFGAFPPKSWNDLPEAEPSPATRRWVKSRQIAFAKARQKEAAHA